MSLNNLQVLSLIKVDSLLARTYVGERRILGQAPRKKKQIRREIRQLPPRCVKLFEDETDLLLFPPLRTAWGLRGQPTEVPISGFNARRVVFGTINIDTGHRLFLARQRQRGENFRAFPAIIHSHYRSRHVALLLDEDPSHTLHTVRRTWPLSWASA